MKKLLFATIVVATAFLASCRKENLVSVPKKLERNMDAVSDTSTTDTGGEDKPKPIH